MSMSERVLEEENRRAGRVIPAWRYYGGLLTVFWGGYYTVKATEWFGSWAALVPEAIVIITWVALFSRYKRKSIG